MDSRRAVVIAVLLLVALWWLYPPRQLGAAPRSDVIEITYMGPAGPLAGPMSDVIRAFETQSEKDHEADPSKPIYRVISGQNAAPNQVSDPTRFLVSVAGNAPPDVIEFDRYAVAEWAARGGFVPLDSYIAADVAAKHPLAIDPEAYFPAAWNEAKYGDKVFGIPFGIDDRALVYNRDLLRRAGLVDAAGNPLPPRNWSELRSAMRKMTKIQRRTDGQQITLEQLFDSLPPEAPRRLDLKQYSLIDVGFIPMYGDSWLYMWGWMNGGEFMSPDGTKVTLNDPKIVEALAFMKSLYDELGGYSEVKAFEQGFQTGGAFDPFVNGHVAMKIGGIWDLLNYGRYAKNLDFAASSPPVSDAQFAAGVRQVTWTGGFAYAIPATAQHKDAAWALIRYLSSDAAIAMRVAAERSLAEAEGRLYVPKQDPKVAMNTWLYEHYMVGDPQMPAKYTAVVKTYNDLLPYSRFRPITPVGQLLWNYHVTSTEDALYGTLSPQASLDHATAQVQSALDNFLKPPEGIAVRSWVWFFVLYAVLALLVMTAAFGWDTKGGFRGRVLGLLRMRRAGTIDDEPLVNAFSRPQWVGGWVCAAPWIIGFLVFGGGPMLFSFVISFCRWDILNTPVFTGLDNYRNLMADGLAWKALGNTFFMVLAVPMGMALSLAIALLLNQGVRALGTWRTFFYLPSIAPFVATSLLFFWILNPQAGLLTRVVQPVLDILPGQIHAPNWLQDPSWAKPSLILMGLWGAGGGMILWLAGLKGIPQSLYEAAAVDGATTFQQFRTITIPQLTPYIFFNLVIGLIGTLQVFGQAFIMTQGGPANSTLFYVYYLFNNAFRYGQMGYASALAWLLFAITLALTVVQLRGSKRWVHYDNS